MRPHYPKTVAVLLLLQILLNCTFQESNKNNQNKGFDSGKAIVDHLDHLFDTLSSKKNTDKDFQESVVTLNEAIRQTIEYNITSPQLLKEIQAYFPAKKHDFSFILSNDGNFGVFSWRTQKKEFLIKNMAFYVNGGSVFPTSLYGNPSVYEHIDFIQNDSGIPTYILGELKNASPAAHQYHLSAYVIRKDGIEEANVFPNGESSITIRCNEQNLETCLKIENSGNLPKTLYSAVVQQTLSYDDGEYIFE